MTRSSRLSEQSRISLRCSYPPGGVRTPFCRMASPYPGNAAGYSAAADGRQLAARTPDRLPQVHFRASRPGGNIWRTSRPRAWRMSSPHPPRSAISMARPGRLFYRGYDISQLAGAATFEEIAYLLQRGAAAQPRRAGRLPRRARRRPGAGQAGQRQPGRSRRAARADGGAAHAWSRWPARTTRTRTPTRRRRTRARRPGSPRSSPPGRRLSTPPARAGSAVPRRSRPRAGRQLPAPVHAAPPRARGRPRSWTPAWCCTPTTR